MSEKTSPQRLEHGEPADISDTSFSHTDNSNTNELDMTQMSTPDLLIHLQEHGIPIEASEGYDIKTEPVFKTNSTYRTHVPDPRLAQLINALEQTDLNLEQDITLSVIERDPSYKHHSEPYIIVNITKWNAQIAVTNSKSENSYVSGELKPITEWETITNNKPGRYDDLKELNIANVTKSGLTTEKWTNRLLHLAKNGVEDAKITKDVILNAMYASLVQTQKPPKITDKSPTRPTETFTQYQSALYQGQVEGMPKGSGIRKLFLSDIKKRALRWKHTKNDLPDENTDEIVDPDHQYLKEITWKQLSQFMRKNKAYNFLLSEEWQNQGLKPTKQPQTHEEHDFIDAALCELEEKGKLPTIQTKSSKRNINWKEYDTELRQEGSSLAREFRKTGLKQLEEAYQTRFTKDDIRQGKNIIIGILNTPVVTIIPEEHPARTLARQKVDEEPGF